MPQSIKDLFLKLNRHGFHFPFVHDPTEGKPSVTLMFFYLSFFLAFGSILVSTVLLLLKGDLLSATIMPTMLLLMGFIFYRLRKLDNVKIDLDDKEINLSGSEEK